MKSTTNKGNATIELVLIFPFLLLALWGLYTIFERGHHKQKTIIEEQAPLWKDLLK